MAFFTSDQIKADKKSLIAGCSSCPMGEECPNIEGYTGKSRILFVLDYPTKGQNFKGDILVGTTIDLLEEVLADMKCDIADYSFTYAVQCRPKKGAPSPKQVAACEHELKQDIRNINPHVIIPLGDMALSSTLSHAMHHGAGIDKWRGWQIPDRELNAWVCPTFHPKFLIENVDKKYNKTRIERFPVYRKIWQRDLQEAIVRAEVPLPRYKDERSCVTILTNPEKINEVLERIYRESKLIAFDYETTGLRPQAPGMKLVSCAIADSPDRAWAFPVTNKIRKALKKILAKPQILKIAANMGFEERWSRVHLDTEVQGWYFDVNTGGHILDSRKGVSNVKFMTYAYTGLADFNSHLEGYLKGRENHANSLNRINEIHQKDLLMYNGIDAIVEYRIAIKQLRAMDRVEHLPKN